MRTRERLCAFMAVTLFGSFVVLAQSVPQNNAAATGIQVADNKPSEKPQPSLGAIFENATASDRTMVMLIIKTVVDGGPADKAGMKKGDTILSLDSRSVANLSDLQGVLVRLAVGSTIKVGYLRDGQRLETEATLAEKTKLYADWYDARAQRGDSEAEFELGRIYFLGTGRSKDDTQAIYWVRKAAEQGYPNAESALGFAYLNGNAGVDRDDLSAVHWFQRAADHGLAEAQATLAYMYAQGRGGLPKDDSQAVNWFRKAAEQGLADAQLNLGKLYSAGRGGLPKDEAQAVAWFRKAAEQGDGPAQAIFGLFYEQGRGGLVKDDSQAAKWYTKAAEQGVSDAEYNLGQLYMDGRGGLPKDDAQAVFWIRKAAEQGGALAQAMLGLFYNQGRGGLNKDDSQAVYWWRKGAEKGNADAQGNLAFMYNTGQGGLSKDDAQAVFWLRKAAVQGNARSQFSLGNMYESGGGGLLPDIWQAALLYRKAVIGGNAAAKDRLEFLSAKRLLPGFGLYSLIERENLASEPHLSCPQGTHRVPGSDSGFSYEGNYVMWFADLDTTCVWYRCEEDEIPNPARCASLGQKGDDTLPGGKPFNSLYTKAADFNWSRKGSCESKRANFCEPSSEDKALEQRKQARTPAGFCQLWPDAVYKPGVDGRFPRDQFDLGNGYFPRKDIDEDATLATMEADEIPCMNNPELKTVATLRSELPAKLAHLREVAQKEAAAREARERVEAAAREQRELKALAGMVTPWSKAQCIRAINNFIRNGGIVFSVRAATLWIASENLGRCENYAWTFEERNQLALPIPFKQVEDSEQNVLAQALNAKIVDFIRQKNLTEKFAWEVGHNSIVASDSIGFLRRNGLEQEFNRNDDLKFQKMDAPGRMNETHATALLLGVVTQ